MALMLDNFFVWLEIFLLNTSDDPQRMCAGVCQVIFMFIMIMIYYFWLLFINFLEITLNLCRLFLTYEKNNCLFDKI